LSCTFTSAHYSLPNLYFVSRCISSFIFMVLFWHCHHTGVLPDTPWDPKKCSQLYFWQMYVAGTWMEYCVECMVKDWNINRNIMKHLDIQ
jgi:hypothetical protein